MEAPIFAASWLAGRFVMRNPDAVTYIDLQTGEWFNQIIGASGLVWPALAFSAFNQKGPRPILTAFTTQIFAIANARYRRFLPGAGHEDEEIPRLLHWEIEAKGIHCPVKTYRIRFDAQARAA